MPKFAGFMVAAAVVLAASGGVPAAAAESAAPDRLAAVQATFDFRLLTWLAGTDSSARNFIVSPASLGATLAFLDLGADPRMHAALVETLGYQPGEGGAALQTLRDEAKVLAGLPPGWGPLAFANAIFVDPDAEVFPEALSGLVNAGTPAYVAPINQPDGLAAINDWVAKRTAGAIPTILDQPLSGAALVALNAFRFRDDWANQFDADGTRPAPFHLTDGKTSQVEMMHREPMTLPVLKDDRFVGVVISYKTARFSMVVVTTKDAPANLADFASVSGWLAGDGFEDRQVNLAMPKFDIAATAHLLPALEELGLREGESPTAFAGFSKTPLVLSDVIQKTKIKVDETGTDAAAATAVVARAGARPDPEIVVMTLDRPFLFAIREEASGLILLSGYVGNPAAD